MSVALRSPVATGSRRRQHPAPHTRLWVRLALVRTLRRPFFWSVQLIATYSVAAHTCFPQRVR